MSLSLKIQLSKSDENPGYVDRTRQSTSGGIEVAPPRKRLRIDDDRSVKDGVYQGLWVDGTSGGVCCPCVGHGDRPNNRLVLHRMQDLYFQLGDPNPHIREQSALSIVHGLKGDINNADTHYILKRLVRGCGSSRAMCRHGFGAALGLATNKLIATSDGGDVLSHLLFLIKNNTAGIKKAGEGIDGLIARAIALAAIVDGGAVTKDDEAEQVADMAWELYDAAKKQSMVRLLAARVIVLLFTKGQFQLKSVKSRTTMASSDDVNPAVVQVPALSYVYFSTRPEGYRLSKEDTIQSIVNTLCRTTSDYPSPSRHPAWEPLLQHTDGKISGEAITKALICGNVGEKALLLQLLFGLGKFFGPWPKDAVELLLKPSKELRKTQDYCLERMSYYFGPKGPLNDKIDDESRNNLLMAGIDCCNPGTPAVTTKRILSICLWPLDQEGVSTFVSSIIPLSSSNRWVQERLCNAVAHPKANENAIKSVLDELLKEGDGSALAVRKALTSLSRRPTGDWASVAFESVRASSSSGSSQDMDKLAKRVLKTIKKSDHKEAIGPWLKWQWVNVAAPGGEDIQEGLDNLDGAIGAANEFDAIVGALPDLYGESKNIVRYSTGRLWQYLVKEGYVSWADADEMVKDICGENEEEEEEGEDKISNEDNEDDLDEQDYKPFLPPIIATENGNTDDIVMEDEEDLLAMLNDEEAERAAQAFIQQQGKSTGAKEERGKEGKVVIMRKIHRIDLLEAWVTTNGNNNLTERIDVVIRILEYAGRMRVNKKGKEGGGGGSASGGGDGGLNEAKIELRNRLIGMVRRFRQAGGAIVEGEEGVAPSKDVILKLIKMLPNKETAIQEECANLIAYLSKPDPQPTADILTNLIHEWCSGGKLSINHNTWECLTWPLLSKVHWSKVLPVNDDGGITAPSKPFVFRELLIILHRLAKSKLSSSNPTTIRDIVYKLVKVVADKWSSGTLGRTRGQIATRAISALMAVSEGEVDNARVNGPEWDKDVIEWLEELKKQTALGAVSKLAATALGQQQQQRKKRQRDEGQDEDEDEAEAAQHHHKATKKAKATSSRVK
ncbi:hypothetical protein FOL47_005530 [Perkinsus chesapeaki]|uniref:Uncharacterized protein n=1 Tax=Perkinsus chesapeaki TaxID=330153 RepID=A0A7J6LX32_PERCH|nr:hypothetical protein FOL47_005530 [Perkinsus chesapeaki]